MKTHQITSFEIIDHGIEGSQYFQGCGTAFSKFDHAVTGAGENALEAFDDALEQIASWESVDLTLIENSPEYKKAKTKKAQRFTVEAMLRRQGLLKRWQDMSDIDCDSNYFLSIRYCIGMSDARLMACAGLA